MRASSVLWFIAVNLVLVSLAALIQSDYAYRNGYFLSEGFVPTTRTSLFAFVTAATRGSTYIPGLLTLDWSQVLVVILVLFDLSFVWGATRERRRA